MDAQLAGQGSTSSALSENQFQRQEVESETEKRADDEPRISTPLEPLRLDLGGDVGGDGVFVDGGSICGEVSGKLSAADMAKASLGARKFTADLLAAKSETLPREQLDYLAEVLPREQPNQQWEQGLNSLLPSEQETEEQQEQFLKSLLPTLSSGWWDVAANGAGFIIKQKWREQKKQLTQPYKRLSREQYESLKGSKYATQTIADRIAGHLDECLADPDRCERARSAAARLSIEH